ELFRLKILHILLRNHAPGLSHRVDNGRIHPQFTSLLENFIPSRAYLLERHWNRGVCVWVKEDRIFWSRVSTKLLPKHLQLLVHGLGQLLGHRNFLPFPSPRTPPFRHISFPLDCSGLVVIQPARYGPVLGGGTQRPTLSTAPGRTCLECRTPTSPPREQVAC